MLIRRLLRVFFYLLYHPFAFTYDLVAATVSFGRWKDWVMAVIPLIEGTRILELGHGPGHLQRVLRSRSLVVFGLDESAPMGSLAKARLRKSGYQNINLIRGISQELPLPSNYFDTIISTFPSEYIFDLQTLAEARRCLLNGGRMVVLPVAWPKNRFLSWLFRVTHEAPSEALQVVSEKLGKPFEQAGFEVEIKTLEVQSSILLLVLARKKLD